MNPSQPPAPQAAEDDQKLLIFGWITTILGLPAKGDPTKYNELTDKLYDLKLHGVPAAAESGETLDAVRAAICKNHGFEPWEVAEDMKLIAAAVQAAQVELLERLKQKTANKYSDNLEKYVIPVAVIDAELALLDGERRENGGKS